MAEAYGGTKGRQFAERACRVLGYFECTGEIPGRFTRHDATAPQASARILELYIANCARGGLSSKTIAARGRDLCQFLWHVEDHGATFPDDVDAALIDSWAESRHSAAPGNMHRSLSSVRCFLTHLFVVGLTKTNLGPLVPSETRYPTRPVSKVWTDGEVASLVASIPTADSVGKRDKAICMLLATYGMRSGDVCGLALADLDFDAGTILRHRVRSLEQPVRCFGSDIGLVAPLSVHEHAAVVDFDRLPLGCNMSAGLEHDRRMGFCRVWMSGAGVDLGARPAIKARATDSASDEAYGHAVGAE